MTNFNLQSFVKRGLLEAIGHLSDYKIILNAAGWADKGVFEESDLAEIQAAIDAKNAALETEE